MKRIEGRSFSCRSLGRGEGAGAGRLGWERNILPNFGAIWALSKAQESAADPKSSPRRTRLPMKGKCFHSKENPASARGGRRAEIIYKYPAEEKIYWEFIKQKKKLKKKMKEPQILSSLNLKFAPLCLSPNAQGRDFSSFRSFVSVCARISRRGDETEPRDAETLPLKIRFPTPSAACGLELFRPHPKSRFFGAAGAVCAGTWEQFSVREKTPFIPI